MFSKASRELGRTWGSRHPLWQMGFLDYTIPQKHTILAFLLEMDPGPACPSLCPHHPPGGVLLPASWLAHSGHVPPSPLPAWGSDAPVASGVTSGCSHRKVKSDHCLCPSWQEPLSRALTLLGSSLQGQQGWSKKHFCGWQQSEPLTCMSSLNPHAWLAR